MSAAAFKVRGLLLTVNGTDFPVENFTMDVEVLSSAVLETAIATLQAELDRRSGIAPG